MRKSVLTMAVLTAVSASVWAAPADSVTTDEVVVTATRTEQLVKEVPESVEVITREDIENLGADNLRAALRLANNVNLSKAGMTGNQVSIRGMESQYTLILIDGKRLAGENTTATANAYTLDRINIDNVERIEIVRGNSSAIYGADALGGVINIITKESKDPKFTLGVSTGAEEVNNWYRWDSGKQGNLSLSLDARFTNVREESRGDGNSNLNGPRQQYNLDAKYDISDNRHLTVNAGYMKEKLRTKYADNEFGMPYVAGPMASIMYDRLYNSDPVSWNASGLYSGEDVKNFIYSMHGALDAKDKKEWYDNTMKNFSLAYDAQTNKHDFMFRAYYSELKKESRLYNAAEHASTPFDFDLAKYSIFAVEGRDTVAVNDKHLLTFGGEYQHTTYEGTRVEGSGSASMEGLTKGYGDQSMDTQAVYVQDEWQINDKLLLIPSLRFDHNDKFGSYTSPKLGATYKLNKNYRLKGSFGKGFKAPTLADLYMDMTRNMMGVVHVVGNPDLDPEKSTNFEIGIEGEKNGYFGDITYFHSDVRDKITDDTQAVPGGYESTYINVDEAEIDGIEVTLGKHLNRYFTLKGTYNYLDGRDKADNSRLSGMARSRATIQLEYDDNQKYGYHAVLWQDWTYDYLFSGSSYDYSTTNIMVNKRINDRARVFAGVDNIFDKEVYDLYLDGRLWRVGAEFTF